MSEYPAPPVYPDLDLRDFPYMPLDVVRLRDSEMAVLSSGEEFRAAVMLWCAAWHQVPASSLPNDDRILANLAGFGRDVEAWMRIKEAALHGFALHADGKLYHSVIAEKATEADNKRKAFAERGKAGANARWKDKQSSSDAQALLADAKGREGKGIEEKGIKKETEEGANAPQPMRKKRERKVETRISDSFEPNWEAATRVGLSRGEAQREFQKFKNHAAMKERTVVNWQAAWSNWCINAAQYLKKPPPGSGPRSAFTITPESRSWNAWKAHFRDNGDNVRASMMDKCADEGRPFTVSSEWPPGHEMNNAA